MFTGDPGSCWNGSEVLALLLTAGAPVQEPEMASVFKRSSGICYVTWRDPASGKRLTRSNQSAPSAHTIRQARGSVLGGHELRNGMSIPMTRLKHADVGRG